MRAYKTCLKFHPSHREANKDVASVSSRGSVGKNHKPALDRTGITGLLADNKPDLHVSGVGGELYIQSSVQYQAGQKLKLYHESGRVIACIVSEDGSLLNEVGFLSEAKWAQLIKRIWCTTTQPVNSYPPQRSPIHDLN